MSLLSSHHAEVCNMWADNDSWYQAFYHLPSRQIKLLFWNGPFCSCNPNFSVQLHLLAYAQPEFQILYSKDLEVSSELIRTHDAQNQHTSGWRFTLVNAGKHLTVIYEWVNSWIWKCREGLDTQLLLRLKKAKAKLVFTIVLFLNFVFVFLEIGYQKVEFCVILRTHCWKVKSLL